MHQLKYVLGLFLILICESALAHTDFWRFHEYGNIKVRIRTGFDYEEINKALIIGQLAEKLVNQHSYTAPVLLDFNHYYVGDCNPDYFLSFDKGRIGDPKSEDPNAIDSLKEDGVVIRQVAREFDAEATLKLLEYAVLNVGKIQSAQQPIEYNHNYCQWRINSIDTAEIRSLLKEPHSQFVAQALSNRIERPDTGFKYGLSYYFKDNWSVVFVRDRKAGDEIVVGCEKVYDFIRLSSSTGVVFDTDSSFYYIGQYNAKPQVSTRQVIDATSDHFMPYEVKSIGRNKLSIYFWYYSDEPGIQPKERTLIYLIKSDKLIQDLDKLIDHSKE